MKNKNKIFFFVFVPVWAAIILWNFLMPAQEFSETENRYLKQFPEFSVDDLLDGGYMNSINTYFSDQFAGRPYWVMGQTLMEYGIGKREVNKILLGRGALLADLPEEDVDYTAQNIAGINDFVEIYGIVPHLMLVPGSAAVQPNHLPRYVEVWDELGFIDSVVSRMNSSVRVVAADDSLLRCANEYIYYRTDHHWTTYGAYLAYVELTEAMGIPAMSREEMDVVQLSDDFFGTYHSKTVFPLVEADSMELYQSGTAISYEVFDGLYTTEYDSIYFEEYLSRKDKYSYFLGTVQPVVTIHTEASNDKKLLVFKDSYAHALMPMLLDDFSEIRLVDLRYMNSSALYKDIEIERFDEVLFLYSTDVFAHQLGAGKLSIY